MVGTGGFAGSACRYLFYEIARKWAAPMILPYVTMGVNVLGCLMIGFLGGLSETRDLFSPETRALVFIGFLGGFTTFSTFGYEIFTMARNGLFFQAAATMAVHLTAGISAVWIGFCLSRLG